LTPRTRQSEQLDQWFRRWSPLFRTLWLLLFLVHLVPVYAVSKRFLQNPSLGNVVSLFVLFGILTLSALKMLDVAYLRVPLNRRSIFGLIVLALWVHGDVVAHKLPEAITIESTITLTLFALVAMRRVRFPWAASLTAFLLKLQQFCRALFFAPAVRPLPLLLLHQVPPRAPPRRSSSIS
jgi:hypothetical protein